MAQRPPVRLSPAQIAARARAFGLDPDAVLRVGSAEGLSGGIGDSGHAYGPFQLNNAGGVLTGIRPGVNDAATQAWAWSPEGIDFALSRIAQVAKGRTGADAVRAIVTQFERPADPQGEIARALSARGYGSLGAGAADPPAAGGRTLRASAGSPVAAALTGQAEPLPDPRAQLLRALAGTQGPDMTGFYRQLGRARQNQQAQAQAQAAHTQALTIPPTRPEPGMAPRTPTTQAQAQTPGSFAELLHEGVGGPTHSTGEHIHFASTNPQTELQAIKLAESLGLNVRENPYTDPVDPVHAKNSYHYRTFPGMYNGRRLGEAADASGDRNAMLRLYALLSKRQGRA